MEKLPEFIANHLFLSLLLIAILMLLIWNFFGDTLSGVKSLIPFEVTLMINRDNAKVIDVRSQSNFEKGHIIGAINISADQLGSQLEKLKRYEEHGVILCCTSGSDSIKESRKLMNEGFERVYCLKGGVLAWQSAGLPLTRGLE